jgi:transcriptional regulator with XRE-family HTH domain
VVQNGGMDRLAANIREMRRRAAMTQDELAREAGVSGMTLSRIERGESEPRASTLRKLAKALEVKPQDLFEEDED